MMRLSREQEKKVLAGTLALLVLLIVYRVATSEKPRTAPLVFQRGAVAQSSVRQGLASQTLAADPLSALLAKREEKFPGVSRDIFRMNNPAPKPKQKAPPVVAAPLPPPVPEKTPEEIAAELSRADLSKFRFLGYLTDKDNSLFLSKDGELFIVKSGGRLLKTYQVKEAGKDYVVLLDTATHVEVRIDLSGGEPQTPAPGQRMPPPWPRMP